MVPASAKTDDDDLDTVLELAFPQNTTYQAAHGLIGDAITALVDRGHSLTQARARVRRALTAIINVYEC